MKKQTCIIIILFLMLFSIIGWTMSVNIHLTNSCAKIYQNGELLYTIDLEEVKEPYEIKITGDGGCENTILVKKGEIGVVAADCPDKVCIHTGFISDGIQPVVCLPNKLVIQIEVKYNIDNSGVIDGVAK